MTRALISSIALAAAMTLSSGAMAQTMVGGHDVSAEDLPKVQKWCDDLMVQENASAASNTNVDDNDAEDTDDEASGPQTADSAATDADGAQGIDQATTSFDISTITLDQCKEAGLIK